jgi:hypothetical protein
MRSFYTLSEITLQYNEYEQETGRRKINSDNDIMTTCSHLNKHMSRVFFFSRVKGTDFVQCLCMHELWVLLSCNERCEILMASYHHPKSTRLGSSVTDATHLKKHQTVSLVLQTEF